MSKKIAALLLVLVLMLPFTAFAEIPNLNTLTEADRTELLDALLSQTTDTSLNEALLKHLPNYSDESIIVLNDLIAAEIEARGIGEEMPSLQNGSNGEEVRLLQARLIELGYLSGSADGAFGNKTAEAVRLFQQEAGLTQTVIADHETQKALFSDDAPVAKVYLNIDFKAMSRDPDSYTGKNYTFSGKVLQVMESDSSSGTLVNMRIATKGNYDDVVYVVYTRKDGESRILEDDRVVVYGTSGGLYTYETVLGSEVSLPLFIAESVTLK